MPLDKSPTKEAVSRNISELTHHGSKPRSQKQKVAIALDTARRAGAKFQTGGKVHMTQTFCKGGKVISYKDMS